jgi:hypothetical protein
MFKKVLFYTLAAVAVVTAANVQAANEHRHHENQKNYKDQHGREFHHDLQLHIVRTGVPQEWPGTGGHTYHQKAGQGY